MTQQTVTEPTPSDKPAGATERWEATCPECGETFTSRESFRKHAREKHGAGKKFRCSDCGQRFDNLDDLDVHAMSCPKK
jgi:uncharacterized C2H2 Zn-finger protein